jgi:hypothetical protein
VEQGLINSRRMTLQATHTPIALPSSDREALRAAEKRSIVAAMRLRPAHLDQLAAAGLLGEDELDALRSLSGEQATDLQRTWRAAARLSSEKLVAVIDHLVAHVPRAPADAPEAEAAEAATEDAAVPALAPALSLEFLREAARSTWVEPIGYLHLEKLAFTPIDTERGELLYSVPLTSKEISSWTHREWSNVSEEFARLETDVLEEFSEQGVVEKNELQVSTENEYQHATELSASVNISGQYGLVHFVAGAAVNVSDSTSRSDKFSRETSSTVTRKASRRSVKEHTMSFRTARASGSEDSSLKRIENPNSYPIRYDYYRMMRKWSVDLYRYGVRLTYDLVIPEPGADLLAQIMEIQELNRLLTLGFGDPGGPDWAKFPLKPSELTPTNFAEQAAKYGTVVEGPPAGTKSISPPPNQHTFGTEDEAKRGAASSVQIDVDPSYTVTAAHGTTHGWEWPGYHDRYQTDHTVVDDAYATGYTHGRSGRVSVPYKVRWAASHAVTVTLDLTLTTEAFTAWQSKAWATIRDAAERRYQQTRNSLQQRLADLHKLMGEPDTLMLRRMEREEIMKTALKWLFGPDFVNASPFPKYYTDLGNIVSDDVWRGGLVRGGMIRFLQQAIEWENVLYLVYPYFWAERTGIDLRKYLSHPDPTHQAFLRSGAARVVLTIRPEFEAEFLEFLIGGTLPSGSEAHYLTIAKEMQAFANTNYPGIRPANPVEDARPLLTYGQRKTWESMQAIQHLLELYREKNGRYPDTSQGLSALQQTAQDHGLTLDTTDFWNDELRYSAPGLYAEYDLASLGADHKEGGEGEDADITSWAEASLVAQWFEYTPTGSLDIDLIDDKPAPRPTPPLPGGRLGPGIEGDGEPVGASPGDDEPAAP